MTAPGVLVLVLPPVVWGLSGGVVVWAACKLVSLIRAGQAGRDS